MENIPVKDDAFYLNCDKLFSDKDGHLDRRTEFRKYLDKTGVLDKLTEILMELYEVPFLNFSSIEYVRKNVSVGNPDDEEIARLKPMLEEAKGFRDFLEKENKSLKAMLKMSKRPTSEEK